MGNCAKTESKFDPTLAACLSDFDQKYLIGRGGFGRVWKVSHKKLNQDFAMKVLSKGIVVKKNSVPSIMNERCLLGILRHPFIVNLHYAFQDDSKLYLVLDMMQGGDLRYYFVNSDGFNEDSLKFLSACILAGLEYLHNKLIIHRDIKPENLVFDDKGYLHITDFGIARTVKGQNTNITSGTPGYMAPEVICRQDHGTAADYFALGVILYECIMGARPYNGSNKKEVREHILAKQIKLKEKNDSKWSNELFDFVNKLLQRKPYKRIGYKGVDEIKEHKLFDGFDWEKLYKKELKSPFKFKRQKNFDIDHVMKPWDENAQRLSKLNSQKLFAGYLYDATLFRLNSN